MRDRSRRRAPGLRPWVASLLLALAAGVPCAGTAGAAVIGYWRMDTDLDGSALGLEVPNEVAGSSMISSEAGIDTTNYAPFAGNTGAAMPLVTGTSSDGVNGQVASYAALDVSSITIELFARTIETTATLFGRTSGSNGVLLEGPNALQMSYWVDDGLGGATEVVLSNLDDMGSSWAHYAFSYDAATGVGAFYVDGVLVASNDGPDGRGLVWGAGDDLFIGYAMDNSGTFEGVIDEFRISDQALLPSAMLVPEPDSVALLALGLIGLAVAGRRR